MGLFDQLARGDSAGALDTLAPAQPPAGPTPAASLVRASFDEAFDAAGAEYGIDPDILRGMAYAESRFRPDVIDGTVRSARDAAGLMQFLPGTARQFGINPLDPIESIFGAAKYMSTILAQHGGDYEKAVAGYNWGPNRSAFGKDNWQTHLPTATRDYLEVVRTAAAGYTDSQGQKPLPEGVAEGVGYRTASPPLIGEEPPVVEAPSAGDTTQPEAVIATSARAWQGAGAGRGQGVDERRLDLVKRESVLQGQPWPEPTFNAAEAERLSNRQYAQSTQDALDALAPGRAPAPRIAPITSPTIPFRDDGIMGRAADLAGAQVDAYAAGLGYKLGDAASALGATGVGSALQGRAAAAQARSDLTGQSVALNADGALEKYAPQVLAVFPTLAVAAATGGLPVMFGIAEFQSYAEGRKAGLPPLSALQRAVPMGAAEVLGEKLGGTGNLFKALDQAVLKGGSRAAMQELSGKMLASGLKEVPSEELTYGLQFGIDKAPGIGLKPDATLADFKQGAIDTAIIAAGAGGAMGAGGGALTVGSRVYNTPQRQAAGALSDALTGGQFSSLDANLSATNPNLAAPKVEEQSTVPTVPTAATANTPAAANLAPPAATQGTDFTAQAILEAEAAQSGNPDPTAAPTAEAPTEAPVTYAQLRAQRTQPPGTAIPQPTLASDIVEAATNRSAPEPAAAQTEAAAPAAPVTYAQLRAQRTQPVGTAIPQPNLATPTEGTTANVQNVAAPSQPLQPQAQTAATQTPAVEGVAPARPAATRVEAGAGLVQADGVVPAPAPAAVEQPDTEAATQLGRNNTPLTEGGKPYKTKVAATAAHKLQPALRVVRVDGGYALADKTPGQLAVEERNARRLSVANTSPANEAIPAHAMIAAEGGLAPAERSDMGMQGNVRIGNRTLFAGAGRGLTIERATEKLIEDGYLPEDASHDQARSLIKRSLTNPQYTPEGTERMAEREAQARADANDAEQLAIAVQRELDDNQWLNAVEGAEAALSLMQEGDTQSDMSRENAFLAMGFTEQEYQNALTDESREPQGNRQSADDPTQTATGQSPQSDRGREGTPSSVQGQDTGLTAPSQQDVLAQQDRRDNAQALDQREQIGREASSQTLTGQTSPEQRQDTSGDMFAMEKATAEIDQRNAGRAAKNDPNQSGMFDQGEAEVAATYVNGDRAEYTGETQTIAGGLFYQVRYTEGTKNGETAVTQRAPDGNNPGQSSPTPPSGIVTPQITPARTQRAPAAANIEDSGQVLEGAPKLYAKNYADKMVEGRGMDTAAVPLSQSWPEPDYQRLLDDGADPWAVALAHAVRDEIPNKPSSWKLKGWVTNVEMLRDMADKALNGEITQQQFQTFGVKHSLMDWFNKIDLYQGVGHGRSLKAVTFAKGSYGMFGGETFSPPKVMWTITESGKGAQGSWRNGNWGNQLVAEATKVEAILAFQNYETERAAAQEGQPAIAKATTFDIYSYRSKPGFIVGKRLGGLKSIDLKTFETVKEAREYKTNNQAELERLLQEAKLEPAERGETNSPRVGADHRHGTDVTTAQFRDTFGFRGEQFGASMPQGERQANLNQAYDALMDLAGVVGVPAKALSLNGELGLAFGARGKGGKRAGAAHYELDTTGSVTPNRVVINLTRQNGAGSLAHEWFHAVDNYFARMRGEKAGMLTNNPNPAGEGVRPEMVAAFNQLMMAIEMSGLRQRSKQLDKQRVKDYWSTGLEMAARSFESYVIAKLQDQNYANDYLANIVSEAGYTRQESYPYPTMGETPAIRAAFDGFFETVQTKQTAQGVAMFAPETEYGYTDSNGSLNDTPQADGERAYSASGLAADDAVRGRDAPLQRRAQIVGLGIAAEIQREGSTALIGRNASSASDLAELAQIYRDPRYETFRVFFTKGDTIVHATGISARLPGQTPLMPAGMKPSEYAAYLQADMDRTGADGYYILHNHPSGNPTPSAPDVGATEWIAKNVPGMRAHVVINSNKFAVITPGPDASSEVFTRDFGEDKLLQASKPIAALGRSVSNPDDLAIVGKSMQRPGWITIIGIGADNKVRVVAEAPSQTLNRSPSYLTGTVRRLQRQSGATLMFAVGNNADVNSEPIRRAVQAGILKDAVPDDGLSLANTMGANMNSPFNNTPGRIVAEDASSADGQPPPYNVSGRSNPAQTGSQWEVPENTKFDTFLQKIQDGKIDLKRVQAAIASATQKPLAEAFDARLHETLYAGRVDERSKIFLKTEARPLLDAMARNNVGMPELSDYLLARHAPERNAQIAKINDAMPDGGAGSNSEGVLMTTAAANAYIAALSPGKRTLMTMLAGKIDAITQGTRDILVNEGLETQAAMDAWTGAYKHYVPLFKDETTTESFAAHGTGSGFSVTGRASQRSMGGTGEVSNMLAHVLLQREAAITRAEKNRVAMGLYGLALTQPNSEFWTTVKPNMKADDIAASLQAMGVDPAQMVDMDVTPTLRTVDKSTGKVVTRTNPLYKNLPNAMIVKVQGEDRVILFNGQNERAMRLITNLKNLDGITGADAMMRVIGAPTRWIASLATQYNPAFGLANLTRDVADAMLNMSTTAIKGKQAAVMFNLAPAMRGIGRSAAGSSAADAWSDLYAQFKADGGQTGFSQMQRDPNERAKNIEAELAGLANAGKLTAGKAASAVLGLLDGFNTTLENAVRLSAYKVALDQGISRPKAAQLARELTIDFNRKGSWSSTIGTAYAFFNAAVQGISRTAVTLTGPAGAKIIAGGLALGVIQALMLAAAGFEDDEIPDFTKSKSLIIPTGGKNYISIPLPLGFSAIPNASRNLTELAMSRGKEWDKKLFSVFGNLLGSFNPLGGGNVLTAAGALHTALPTALDPIGDLAIGKDFADRPISKSISPGDPRPGYLLGRESTKRSPSGEVYIGIAEAINSIGGAEFRKGYASPTPEEVRYTVMAVAGGLGREIEKSINASVLAAKGEPVKAYQVPVLGRFAGEIDDAQLQRTRFYANSTKINALKSEMKALSKSSQDQKVEDLVDAHPLVGLYKMNDAISRQIGKINTLANDNISNPVLLKELDDVRTEKMRALNTTVLELEKASDKKKQARAAMMAPEPETTDD